MAGSIGFEFPPDGSGQWDGFNEPGIEHYSGSPFEHLGREVTQNTTDARATSPAKIHVSLVSVPIGSIPGLDELKQALRRCLTASVDESDKAQAFFANALTLLSGKRVSVLQIADYNTTGVVGPCINGTPFFAMMKATGQSKKSGTATGSYGIGKFAPFTLSDLRTVFLTTVWQDETTGQCCHYVQGKSILMSHMDDAGITRRGTGFWGIRKNCMPVDDPGAVPAWLRRIFKDGSLEGYAGTTLSILGFTAKKHWQNVLTANIAENFFGAIRSGDLEVTIEDGPLINQDTLQDIFEDDDIRLSIEESKGEPEKFTNARSYLRALIDEVEVNTEETENYYLGKCQLKILVGEDLPKKVAILRNGMLITDDLARLKRFAGFKEFVAVLECRAKKGLVLLRAMEPPGHDDFEPDRLPPDKRGHGRNALREISQWVRQMLSRHAKDPVSEITSLDELADFFGDEEEAGTAKKKDEDPGGAIVIRQRPVKAKPRATGYGSSGAVWVDGDDEDQNEVGGETTGAGMGEKDKLDGGETPGHGEGDTGGTADDTGATDHVRRTTASGIALQNVRAVPIDPARRRVAFTSTVSGVVTLELQDSGADMNYRLDVRGTSAGAVKDGRIEGLEVIAGQRRIVEVELEREFHGTLRVVANAV